MSRYAIYVGSMSNHCCFEFTVYDSTKPFLIGGEHYKDPESDGGQYHYEPMCECYTREDAELICNALNAAEVKH